MRNPEEAMELGETVSRSPLEKPLHQLTEDDISQLTREDCRRYLKQKGMRRPSWNKSQAIQQVISLKALLETTSSSDSNAADPLLQNGHPSDSDPLEPPPGMSVLEEEESVPNRSNDSPKPVDPSHISAQMTAPQNDTVSPRMVEVTNEPIEQMTVFYSGKVSVYDDISGDKARIIMQLAASPLFLPHAAPSDVITALCPSQCHLQASGVKLGPASPTMIFPRLQTEKNEFHREGSNKTLEDNPEALTSRKASVQRYLEKRKDRFKHKRKVAVPSSAGLDIYLNHVVEDQNPNQQLNRSDAYSPSLPRPPQPQTPTRSQLC
ncbi:Tify domain containing protein [Parasponia andersonii]|uniref:Protein TIFY n=1 Tax=Parasponia andersonii TaxID=3476 RepID=A0A2P5C0A5_PARAD|nr:Tify domain containing protein [Parasponia andersonii]